MGAAIADSWLKTRPKRRFSAVFGEVKSESTGLFASIRECGWNLDQPLYTRIERASTAWWKCAKEGEDYFVSWEGDGHSI